MGFGVESFGEQWGCEVRKRTFRAWDIPECPKYLVTREFVGGVLKGTKVTQLTSVKFEVGFRCDKPIGGSPYVILACEEVKP